MLSFILKIVKNIVLKLATTGAFSFLQPWYPLIEDRIKALEKDSHPPCPLEEFDAYPAIIERIEKLEKKNANSKK